jgi:hypothetical protein
MTCHLTDMFHHSNISDYWSISHVSVLYIKMLECVIKHDKYTISIIVVNSWHTAKLYILGRSRMWLIEISMSSFSSVVTLWDNLGQRSNQYVSKNVYQTLAISFLRTFFVIFTQKTAEVVEKWSRSITPYAFIYILRVSRYRNREKVKKSLFFTTKS